MGIFYSFLRRFFQFKFQGSIQTLFFSSFPKKWFEKSNLLMCCYFFFSFSLAICAKNCSEQSGYEKWEQTHPLPLTIIHKILIFNQYNLLEKKELISKIQNLLSYRSDEAQEGSIWLSQGMNWIVLDLKEIYCFHCTLPLKDTTEFWEYLGAGWTAFEKLLNHLEKRVSVTLSFKKKTNFQLDPRELVY